MMYFYYFCQLYKYCVQKDKPYSNILTRIREQSEKIFLLHCRHLLYSLFKTKKSNNYVLFFIYIFYFTFHECLHMNAYIPFVFVSLFFSLFFILYLFNYGLLFFFYFSTIFKVQNYLLEENSIQHHA